MFTTTAARHTLAALAAAGLLLAAGAGIAAADTPTAGTAASNAAAQTTPDGRGGLPFPGGGDSFNAGIGRTEVGPVSTPDIHAGPDGVRFGGSGLPVPF